MNAPDELVSLPELANDGAVAAVVSDDGGRIVRATSTAAELLGMSAAKMVGVRLIDLAADGWAGAAENAFCGCARDRSIPSRCCCSVAADAAR